MEPHLGDNIVIIFRIGQTRAISINAKIQKNLLKQEVTFSCFYRLSEVKDSVLHCIELAVKLNNNSDYAS